MSNSPESLTILCLHGFRTSAKIMQFQMSPLRYFLGKKVNFEYVDAPFSAEGSPSDGILEFYPEMNYYEWYEREDPENPVEKRQSQIQHSTNYVLELLRKKKYDGLLGFSQGSAVATRVILQLKAGIKSDIRNCCGNFMKSPPPPPSFVIFICGVAPSEFVDIGDGDEKTTINTILSSFPSLHILGENDDQLSKSRSLVELYEPSNDMGSDANAPKKSCTHFLIAKDTGHEFPRKNSNPVVLDEIKKWIEDKQTKIKI